MKNFHTIQSAKLIGATVMTASLAISAIGLPGAMTVGAMSGHSYSTLQSTDRASAQVLVVDDIYQSTTPLRESAVVTQSLRQQLENVANEARLLYGDVADATQVSFSNAFESDNQALIYAHHSNNEGRVLYTASFKLVKQEDVWKVDEIAADSGLGFVMSFYSKLPKMSHGYANDNRLTNDLKAKVDGRQVANPFTLSQVNMLGFSVQQDEVSKQKATYIVTVQELGHAHDVKVEIVRDAGGVWHVNNVINAL